ncbi:Uracil phosphoribosyltransferase [Pseudobythopirellula maris]|uniref:Uracil phosphoribosyltransferase n=1 Tax=Pseudobythopirellula maris TaxID=2527991 RepID=A0A5C5ZU57_9BACT|nr:uracil phosphoribosyltransferase [Pseudobythopirellula maris]TWT90411.1 Uracil phosphoribosyltransferase [Pseudobythopirellula maris]
MPGVFEVDHPLIACHLSRLRDKSTSPEEFRALVRRLATLLAYEATQDLDTVETSVETPLTTTPGSKLAPRIGLVPILRAGLGMVDPVLDLIPTAEVWHLGLYRDEETAQPVEYYSKLPPQRPVDVALVVDPMLATGGSVMAALDTLKQWGVGQVKILSIIASEEGIKNVEAQLQDNQFPNAQVYVCKIDPVLNDQKFIVPGLGDAGDRIFHTTG